MKLQRLIALCLFLFVASACSSRQARLESLKGPVGKAKPNTAPVSASAEDDHEDDEPLTEDLIASKPLSSSPSPALLAPSATTQVAPLPTPFPVQSAPVVALPSKADPNLAIAESAPVAQTAPVVHAKAVPGVDPDQAMRWLKNGNVRYIKNYLRKDGQSSADRRRLTKAQNPHTVIISCSDSRVPPELVFDQKLGEIFVIRSAGQSLDSAGIASVEYAITHLGVRNILVMGHTSCGAVSEAHSAFHKAGETSPHLKQLIADIQPRISIFASTPISPAGIHESWANAKGVGKDLVSRSDIVFQALRSGKIRIHSSMYHTDTGKVDFQ